MIIFLGTYLEPFSYLIYLTAFCLLYRKDKSGKKMVLIIYYFIATFLMIYANWLLNFPREDSENSNALYYNLLLLLTGPFISYYFLHTLTFVASIKAVKIILAIVLIIYFKELWSGHITEYNSLAASASFLFIVICTFLYFHQVLTNISEQNILFSFDFWLIAGYLLFFLGNFFIVLAWHYLSVIYRPPLTYEQRYQFTILWSVHNILLFISSVTTLFASLWINYRRASK